MPEKINVSFLLNELKSVSDETRLEGMKRYAIDTKCAIGVSLPDIRSIAKSFKKNHNTALLLWDTKIHEARILASMIADPNQVTPAMMDEWTQCFYSWDLCDQVCNNLFQKTDFFIDKAFEYSYKPEEYIKRTGFVLMVQYVVHHKKSSDEVCKRFLQRVEEEAKDERNFVKKAVNWCLRQIGKRNKKLNELALLTAYKILEQQYKSAKWIALDAIRELESDAVQKRLSKA